MSLDMSWLLVTIFYCTIFLVYFLASFPKWNYNLIQFYFVGYLYLDWGKCSHWLIHFVYISYTKLIPPCYPIRDFMNCSLNHCHFLNHLRELFTLVQLLAECFLDFHANQLKIICPFAFSWVWMVVVSMSVLLCATCTPILFDSSTIRIILATVTSVVWFVWPTMFFA